VTKPHRRCSGRKNAGGDAPVDVGGFEPSRRLDGDGHPHAPGRHTAAQRHGAHVVGRAHRVLSSQCALQLQDHFHRPLAGQELGRKLGNADLAGVEEPTGLCVLVLGIASDEKGATGRARTLVLTSHLA